jgi:glycosyltransferase involved in cell wall biosynthesis
MVTKQQKIWLVNQYAMPPELESRLRTIKFARYLTDMGYDVTIFASSIMHNMDIDLITDNSPYLEKQYDGLKFVHIKTKQYNNNGLMRVIGMIQFPIKLYFIRKKFSKPDIFIQTTTVPFSNFLYFCAKNLKAKYIIEVLDLWPEMFVDLELMTKRNPLLFFLYRAERWLYKKADKVVFSMEGGKDYIVDKKWNTENGGPIDVRKISYINNGVDLNDFNDFKEKYILEDSDLKNDNLKKVIYLGSIRLANDLKELIDAAEILKDQSNIKFLLYGDGEDREPLKRYCKEKKLENIIFKQKWINPHYVPYVLSKSSVNILNYKSGNFGKYGGSQSKLFQYLASGRPVCSNLNMMYCLINKHNLGISKEFNSAEEYAKAILSLLNMDQKSLNEMSMRMQEVVKEYDYLYLTKKLVQLF